MNTLQLSYHEDVIVPDNLILIPKIYIRDDVLEGFSKRGCIYLYMSESKPFLYGITEEGIYWRCDTQYHK